MRLLYCFSQVLLSCAVFQGNSGVLPSLNTRVNFIEQKGPEVIAELAHQLKLLTLCKLFTEKKFPVFLKSAGYSQQQVLQKSKPGVCAYSNNL